ncbi:MAG TPA: GNAT family N-acetyltransferase [Solirubrobacterales bacterium]|nr:GNAT family N-acetyltransferase [Solirubrobacterales bacterium]
MSARAELIEDRGEAAASGEFFRSRPFLDAEGATHTLRIETEASVLLAPLVVRDIGPGPERDGTSPYGYPGLSAEPGARPLDPATVDFSSTGLVSVFLRHRLDVVPLAGARERNVVQIADPALPPKSRPSDRRQIRRNREAGYELRIVPGPEASAQERAGFLDVYEQTMRRTAAAGHYFFGAAYFERALEAAGTWLALARAPGGELAAASLAVLSDGFLHYYLSGSADAFLADSPMKSVLACLVELAAELAVPLNLGGGIRPGDALEEFKRGFANRQEAWRTSELVCDPEAYARLSAGREAAEFFPAYRAG